MQSVGGFVCRSLHCCRKKESGPPHLHPAVSLPGAAALFCWKAAGSLSKLRAGLPPCVLSGTSERAYRDHDNIEVNMVTDIITLYLLPDDAPRRCAHYYCTPPGQRIRRRSM